MYEEIVQLKMKAEDGKMRETDVADTQSLLRLIQYLFESVNLKPGLVRRQAPVFFLNRWSVCKLNP